MLNHPSLLSFAKGFTSDSLGDFKRELNSVVLKDMRSNKDNISVTVLAVDITRKESEYKCYSYSNVSINFLLDVLCSKDYEQTSDSCSKTFINTYNVISNT